MQSHSIGHPKPPVPHPTPRQTEPDAKWATDIETPWWKDPQYVLGFLTAKTRKIKLLNMLSRQEMILEVCSEETLAEIQRRYLVRRRHLLPQRCRRPLLRCAFFPARPGQRTAAGCAGVQRSRLILHVEADRLNAGEACLFSPWP